MPRLDDRFQALSEGIAQLADDQRQRLTSHIQAGKRLVLDEVHYDSQSGLWCPFAVALDVPNLARAPRSERDAVDMIRSVGKTLNGNFDMNPMSRWRGPFYTRRRLRDLGHILTAGAVNQ